MKLLYEQGNYRLAFWRSEKLMNNPEYDYSLDPLVYRGLSLFHIEGNLFFKNRNPSPWEEAGKIFLQLKSSPEGKKYLENYKDELSDLYSYLSDRLLEYEQKNNKRKYDKLKPIFDKLFEGIDVQKRIKKQNKYSKTEREIITKRNTIISTAKQELGVPYKFGGTNSDGFDCSGFTCYVYKKSDVTLNRSAKEQYELCVKVERENVVKGDLIFFTNDQGEISHVGIVISESGESIKMIHSSSSKGISIVDVDNSEYWKKKLYGFGTVFH
jgi:cell wall-associated NlpC family hydrolase